jgi:hypothetical protein
MLRLAQTPKFGDKTSTSPANAKKQHETQQEAPTRRYAGAMVSG